MVFSRMLCFFEVLALPQTAEHDLVVNFDDLFCLFAEKAFFKLSLQAKILSHDHAFLSLLIFQKKKRFIFALAQHDVSQHCCDCVPSIRSKVGSHTFVRVIYYTKNITSPSTVQER